MYVVIEHTLCSTTYIHTYIKIKYLIYIKYNVYLFKVNLLWHYRRLIGLLQILWKILYSKTWLRKKWITSLSYSSKN